MYLIQTVQTSWRPQLPLPKEVQISDDNADNSKTKNDMVRHQHSSSIQNRKDNVSLNGSQISNASNSHGKKWSFGRLFRKKKEIESESSSEEDRKAGFVPVPKFSRGGLNNSNNSSNGSKTKSKSKSNRGSKLIGAGFDHIVVNPPQHTTPPPPQHLGNEFFLPFETVAPEPYYQNQPTRYQHQAPQQYLQQPPQPQQQFSRSSNSLDRRALIAQRSPNIKSHSVQRLAASGIQGPGPVPVPVRSSSEEELISLNSSTFSKYRSDESIHSGGQTQNGSSRRSRTARNERYYKRLSRDGEVSHGGVPVMYAPQPAQRWKTQPVPLSVYNAAAVPGPVPQARAPQSQPSQLQSNTSQRLRNAGSLQHVAPYVQWGQVQKQPKQLQNSVNDSKRSISYDSHIHLQNVNGRLQTKPLPPPPPPRDPTRRLNVSGHVLNASSSELRPVSYAFDVNGLPVLPATGLNARCVSDDKIWASQAPLYQSAQSLNVNPTTSQQMPNRRFITRAERDAQQSKKSLPNGLDMQYVAEATPRSRKPIHLLEQTSCLDYNQPPPSSGVLRTTKSGLPASPKAAASDFWQRHDEGIQRKTARDIEYPVMVEQASSPIKPRALSSSRVGELRSYPIPMYSEVYKPNRKSLSGEPTTKPTQNDVDEVDNVVCGTLRIKPSPDASSNYVEIRNKDSNKSHSMPNHYQRRSGGDIPTTPNKYEEYVAEKREQHHNPFFDPPAPPQRKLSIPPAELTPKATAQPAPPVYLTHKKPANLEEAINELEAIYKSLRLGNEPTVARKERVPTPSEFEKFALARADSYDDEDSPTGEPDPVRDDVAFRNMKLANLQHKSSEKQLPFGIPIGPIVPSPHNDYLHVTPDKDKKQIIKAPVKVPDIIKDDLAVRALRKDPPGAKQQYAYPTGCLQKKHRATRTQSANIYSLIQRDAAKPAGGDLFSYMELTKNIDRSGSMTDLQHDQAAADIPGTLQLLINLKEQEQEQSMCKKSHIPFRHPSQGGAICQLPEKLTSPVKNEGKPVPLPRKSMTPEPTSAGNQMEDALNKIAKDAQESSAKLTKELRELRKEALITTSRPKCNQEEEMKIKQGLQDIESVSEAAKRCGKMLLDNLPDAIYSSDHIQPRKLHKERKLIEAIDQVSEAANAVCEKILKDIVTTEPPVVVQEAVKVQNTRQTESLVMPNLIKKLDPVQSEQIEAIAMRCMRQISELSEATEYDNLAQNELDSQAACNATKTAQVGNTLTQVDANLITTVSEKPKRAETSKEIEEIDRIMQECEAQVHSEGGGASSATATAGSQKFIDDKTTAPSMTTSCSSGSNSAAPRNAIPTTTSSTTASSFSSSSDCLAKSSSPSAGRRQSSSITSFNPYSSSDYIKSPSSEFHAPSTDPIKTFSTTSYDVHSTSATPNITTNSTFSYSPSPPLNLTPVGERAIAAGTGEAGSADKRERSSSPSQYNSSEELAMIFGIEERPKQEQQRRRKSQQQQQLQLQHLAHAGNVGTNASMSSTSSNHASSFACNSPDAHQHTNPNAACVDNIFECLNVLVATTTTLPTNANNSPCSTKLDTIPEIALEQECPEPCEDEPSLKLSPNFNKLYNSKISIIVDTAADDHDEHSARAELATFSTNNDLTQFDSLSSLEETSSNPDSGNVSLADFPLFAGTTNATIQLQTVYNSRYEIRNRFVSEVCIESESSTEIDELNESAGDEFPPLPTEEELLESLKEESSCSLIEIGLDLEFEEGMTVTRDTDEHEVIKNVLNTNEVEECKEICEPLIEDQTLELKETNADLNKTNTNSINVDCATLKSELSELNETINEATLNSEISKTALITTPQRKKSIVFETPQINMNISEVRLNYDLNESVAANESNADDCHTTDQLDTFDQISDCTATLEKLNEALTEMPRRRGNQHSTPTNGESVPRQLSLLPWQPPAATRSRSRLADDPQQTRDEKPTTSANALTVLGEVRRANSLTVLEHVLAACSLGVLTSNDLFTLFLIIIGVITIVAIVLF